MDLTSILHPSSDLPPKRPSQSPQNTSQLLRKPSTLNTAPMAFNSEHSTDNYVDSNPISSEGHRYHTIQQQNTVQNGVPDLISNQLAQSPRNEPRISIDVDAIQSPSGVHSGVKRKLEEFESTEQTGYNQRPAPKKSRSSGCKIDEILNGSEPRHIEGSPKSTTSKRTTPPNQAASSTQATPSTPVTPLTQVTPSTQITPPMQANAPKPTRQDPPIYAQSYRQSRRRFDKTLLKGVSVVNGPAQTPINGPPIVTTGEPAKGQPPGFIPLTTMSSYCPAEELTKVVADFLFQHVVMTIDLGVGKAGDGSSQGAVLEVEAKLGQLIDNNTNDRLRLPVETECIVSRTDPNLRIRFESSMSEDHHRRFNQFLNDMVALSRQPVDPPPQTPRTPIDYKHTYECDSFYELSQDGYLRLPRSIQTLSTPGRNKTKVRVTIDQKTGEWLATIVKVRIADINIYNPRSSFDWRLSVNLEMNYDGDLGDLVDRASISKQNPDRNKDRLSYRHLAYQTDLTQVSPAEATPQSQKIHELEVEVDTAEVRKHGLLAKDGQANQYEELVRNLIDNVRLLTRKVQ